MASSFPGAIDSFTNPLSNSALNSPSHSGQHSDLNDAVNKVETYMGLVKVIPTSVTNGTLAANGTVTVGNAVSSVTVSGAFSSLYENYRIVINALDCSAGGNDLRLRFDAGGTTNYVGSLYYDLYTGGSTNFVRSNSVASFCISLTDTGDATSVAFDVYSPNLAKRTRATGNYAAEGFSGWFSGFDGSTTQHTAFTILPGTGTMTGGSIRVYGYRN